MHESTLEMPPQQGSRIDLGDLKVRILKRIGVEKSKHYFYYLNQFLGQKLSKNEFAKLCYRLLGRENLPLHNELVKSVLKNAALAKTPPPKHEAGPTKSLLHVTKDSLCIEDGHEQSGLLYQNQNHSSSIWSNGVLAMSPRKGRSGIRDRKLKDLPSSLGLNGKIEISHPPRGGENSGSRNIMENGVLTPHDYSRSVHHLHAVTELPLKEGLYQQSVDKVSAGSKNKMGAGVEDGEEVEKDRRLDFSRSPLLAPLGIPLFPASVGVAHKSLTMRGSGELVKCHDFGGLFDTETLRRRMVHAVARQGLGGVSLECANVLNEKLDVYLKHLINSCIQVAGARSVQMPQRQYVPKQQISGRIHNGKWPTDNHLNMQIASGLVEGLDEKRTQSNISLNDFKVAMELNPHRFGEDWPLLLEKISMDSFVE